MTPAPRLAAVLVLLAALSVQFVIDGVKGTGLV